jgi:DNA (cytosine-5)-methyltransferase 1
MRHGSLFSGIGGFDLAAQWMGWENVFHCEWNEFGQKVLNYYWPKAISYHDITKTDFTIHRGQIDILTGGFPCQPYSAAGKRLGKEDSRHLWPEMLRAIREIQPTWVLGENVLGLVNWNGGLVFHEVQADLEAEGYQVQPYVLPAVSVNAPHRRDRVWFVAYSNKCSEGSSRKSTGTFGERSGNNDEQKEWRQQAEQYIGHGDVYGNSSNTKSMGRGRRWCETCQQWEDKIRKPRSEGFSDCRTSSDTENDRERKLSNQIEKTRSRKSNELFGLKHSIPSWNNFPTQPPICTRDDGFSSRLDGITFPKWRNESIKAGGNAVVPQVVHQIFKAIEQYNDRI